MALLAVPENAVEFIEELTVELPTVMLLPTLIVFAVMIPGGKGVITVFGYLNLTLISVLARDI